MRLPTFTFTLFSALFAFGRAQVELSDINDFEANQARWNNVGPPLDYDFQIQSEELIFSLAQLMDVKVRGGIVTEVTYAEDTGVAKKGDPAPDFYVKQSIEDVFSSIDDAIKDRDTFDLDVTYDSLVGFPTSVFIDPSSSVADEETRISISNFDPQGANISIKAAPYAENLALWNSFGPMLNYNFQYQDARFDRAEYVQFMDVEVRNGMVADVTYAETTAFANAGDPAPKDYSALTIAGLFEFIAKILDPASQTNPTNYEFDFCNVTYDSTLGYPNYLFTDELLGAVDDEVTRTASNLRGANAGLSVVDDQPQPLMTGDVQIGTVLTEVMGDNVEVTINMDRRFADNCCLKETHICNYPMERVFNATSVCEWTTRYSMKMSEMHGFVCDDVGDAFQLDGHATIECNEPLHGADPPPEGSELLYGAVYWINFLCG